MTRILNKYKYKCNEDEILALVAHEMGNWKLGNFEKYRISQYAYVFLFGTSI